MLKNKKKKTLEEFDITGYRAIQKGYKHIENSDKTFLNYCTSAQNLGSTLFSYCLKCSTLAAVSLRAPLLNTQSPLIGQLVHAWLIAMKTIKQLCFINTCMPN